MTWQEFAAAAPDLARLGEERFRGVGIALLATLRSDGWPRVNPIEPFFAAEHLLFGVMSRSKKARDLLDDPRCALHSAVSDPKGADGEFKLYARAAEVTDRETREAAADAWWVSRPPEDARVFALEVVSAAFVGWEIDRGEMTVTRWSPDRGLSGTTRAYP